MSQDQRSNEDNIEDMKALRDEAEEIYKAKHEQEVKKLIAEKDETCKQSKKSLLKMLNSRFTEQTKTLTAEMTEKWKQTQM